MSLQHLQSKTLQSIVIELGAAKTGKPALTLGRAIHAQVLRWLSIGDSEVSKAIHDAQNSPLSLSGLLGNRRRDRVQAGDTFYLRICCLDGSLVEPLLKGLEEWGTKAVVLANFPFVIRTVYTIPGTHRLAGATDYQILAQVSQVMKDIELNFLSPTSFKQKQNIQSFPLPELVFSSLQRRWNAFAPEELHFPQIEWDGLVSAYELKTHALKLEGGAEIGAVGWVRYRFSDLEQAKVASILAHFAFFAGVGRKTTMGMGQVQLAGD